MLKRLPLIFLLCLVTGASALYAQTVVDVEYQGQRTKDQLVATFGPVIQYGVDLWKMTYTTDDVFGQPDTASGLFVVPLTEEPTIFPMLVYQHGTVDGPSDVPSNLQGGWELAAVFGGLGYTTLAPDYLGLGTSRGFHPYVHAESEASAALDMMRAVQAYAPENDILLNDQIFVTGYSQGGHASMALHRAMELEVSDEFSMTAASHMSGPYSISDIMREVILSEEPYFYPAYVPNTFLSYNYVYQLYDDLEQFFKPDYVPVIEQFFNGEIGLSALNLNLISQLITESGASVARNMLQDSIITILESEDTSHPLRQALIDNDVYEWAPEIPARIFYCTADDQVNYQNSLLADSVMNELGAVDVESMDVNPTANHGQCVEPAVLQTAIFFAQFAEVTVDVEDIPLAEQIRLFPNPAREQLQLRNLKEQALLEIFDLQGRLIYRSNVRPDDAQISTQGLSSGTYFLRLNGEHTRHAQKLIIQR